MRDRFYSRQHRNSCRSTRASFTNKHEGCCRQIKGKSKTTTESPRWGRQQPYQYMKEDGLTLSHQIKILLHTISRRKSSIFFDNQTLQREEDGAIEFYKINFHLRNHHSHINNWSDDRWKACLAAGGGSKRRYQYCSDNSGTILYLRALQGHSGNNLIDPM